MAGQGLVLVTGMGLVYPYGSRNAETLRVDPVTLHIFIVTKETDDDGSRYVERAPHGDISLDGSRIGVRDQADVARLFFRDGYVPLEDPFDAAACEVPIQGEASAFTSYGGLVTVSEGRGVALYYIGL